MPTSRKLQIGIIGSAADLRYSKQLEKDAETIGIEIAKRGGILLFGAEKDYDSLSSAAARGAKKAGGTAIGFTYNKGLDVFGENAAATIATGLDRGGGREFPFILSCDAIIAVSGGSGTLTEIGIAYQANIPIVALKGSGGWADKLIGTYLDDRKRLKVEGAGSPRQAVARAVQLAELKIAREKRSVLFACCTHGNEVIGYQALNNLEQEGWLSPTDWLLANPKAFQKKTRFTEADLNRVFPGKKKSSRYEERRAAKILEVAKKFQYVVDIHGTDANTGIFIIISRPSVENILLALLLDIPRVIFWPSTSPDKNIPFNASVPIGIEIECGPQRNIQTQRNLEDILRKFLNNFSRLSFADISERLFQREFYWVTGKLLAFNKKIPWKEFQKVRFEGKTFYPLLLNRYKDTQCYMMKRIPPSELFHHHRF